MAAGAVPNPPFATGAWVDTAWEADVWGPSGAVSPPPPPPPPPPVAVGVSRGVGTGYTSTGLLERLKRELKRPTTDAGVDDDDLYRLLTEGCQWVQALLATHGLDLNAEWEQATTSDNLTYTILDEPVGRFEVRDGRDGRRLRIGADTDPITELVWNGTTFSTPRNLVRTFSNGLWIRYTREHGPVDATTEPTLKPTRARLAAVYKAAELWLDRGGYKDNAWVEQKLYVLLFGDPNIPGSGIIPSQKHGWTNASGRGGAWWRGSPDLIYPNG